MATRESYRAVFDSLPGIYLLLNPDLTIAAASDERLRTTHTSREQAIGRPLFEVFPDNPDDPGANGVANLRASLARVIATRKPDRMDIQRYDIPRSGFPDPVFEERYWSPVNSPVLDESGELLFIIHHVEDVTEKVFAESATRKLEAGFHEQKEFTAHLEDERELRERFVATLTHDLRTPLTAARVGAQLIAKRAGDAAMVVKISGRIIECIDRADGMIHDLLDANRLRAGEALPIEFTPDELNRIAEETLQELSVVHGDRFVLRSDSTRIEGYWSARSLARILENLCGNGIKYGAARGQITVSLESAPDKVRISVHNEGTPISAADQATLFTQYRRTESAQKGVQKGWGLGLTLVKGFAEAHRGTVCVESAEGKGTTFRVTLPRDARSSAGVDGPRKDFRCDGLPLAESGIGQRNAKGSAGK